MTLTNALDPLGKMGLGDRDLPCAGHCGASGSSSVNGTVAVNHLSSKILYCHCFDIANLCFVSIKLDSSDLRNYLMPQKGSLFPTG